MTSKLPDINLSYFLEASPEQVFSSLTRPESLTRWFSTKAMIDPAEGGRFTLVMKNGFVWEGKIRGMKENKAVSFSWVEGVASFALARKGKGTLLKLSHTGFETTDALAQSSAGWSYYLTNLKSVLDHGADLRSKEDSF